MAFQEAFKPVEGAKLEINQNAFQREGELDGKAKFALSQVQDRLTFMNNFMQNKAKLRADEQRVASVIIRDELAKTIPINFVAEYEADRNWANAADRITGTILSNVNHYIGEIVNNEFNGTGNIMDDARFYQVIKESDVWGSKVSPEKAGKIYAALTESRGYKPSETEIIAFRERYKPSSINFLASGAEAIKNGRGSALNIANMR